MVGQLFSDGYCERPCIVVTINFIIIILYSQHRHNTSPAFIVILACWATSLAIGLPIMCGLNHRPEAEVGGWNISEPLNFSRNEIIKTDI